MNTIKAVAPAQKRLTLTLTPEPPKPRWLHKAEVSALNAPDVPRPDPRRGLALRLKKQLRIQMGRVSECSPVTVPANCAALESIRDCCNMAIEMALVAEDECSRTDRQLAHPLSLVDFICAADFTLAHHRSPEGLPIPKDDLQRLEWKVEKLASLLGGQLSAICSALNVDPHSAAAVQFEALGGGK